MGKNLETNHRHRTGLLLVLLIFIGIITGISADSEDEKNCPALYNMFGLVQKNAVQLSLCAKELHFDTPILKASNYMCIVRCALTKIHILTPEGNINTTGAEEFMQNSIPASMKSKTGDTFANCRVAAEKIVPNDKTCESYEPLLKCGLHAIASSLGNAIPEIVGEGLGEAAGSAVAGPLLSGVGGKLGRKIGSKVEIGDGGGRLNPLSLVDCISVTSLVKAKLRDFNLDGLRHIF